MLRIFRLATATVFGAMVAVTLPVSSLPLSTTGGTHAAAEQAAQADTFRWQGRVAAGQSLEIKGVNGRIDAEPASAGDIEVTATKTGRRDNPADVRVEVVEHAGGVTLCAVYPSPDGPLNECVPGKGGRMRVQDNDVKVDFSVRVPAGVGLVARTVNGAIQVGALDGQVEARTVNGSVTVKAARRVQAETVNGSIEAALADAGWDGALEFKTVNGSIEVGLPEGASTQVTAETVNGGLHSDFPVTMQGRFGPKRFEGTIGQGGRELRLKTVNGRISLRRVG
jgi:DUF4097 and DUF4098 domain-containing protein YvlB